jgi:hypothetical protein
MQVQGINSTTVKCIPSETCGASFYCISNYNVAPYISNNKGGSLNITFNAICSDSQCEINSCGLSVVYQLNMQISASYIDTDISESYSCSKVSDNNNRLAYVYCFVTLGFGAFGIMIYMVRKQCTSILIHFSPYMMVLEMSILSLDFITDIIYVVTLYSHYKFYASATILLLVRIVHPGVSAYLLNIIIGIGHSKRYSKLIDNEHLAQNAKLYAVLFFLSILETTAMKVIIIIIIIIIIILTLSS